MNPENESFPATAPTDNVLVYDFDLKTGHIERLCGVKELTGYEPEELAPDAAAWWALIHPEDASRIREAGAAVSTSGPHYSEYRIRHKNGAWRRVREAIVLLRDSSGKFTRIIGMTSAVADQYQANDVIQRTELRYRTVIENLPQLVCQMLPDGATVLGNRAWREFFQRASLAAGEWRELVHPEDRRRLEAALEKQHALDAPRAGDFRLRRHDGEWRWFSLALIPLWDATGRREFTVVCATDVHDQLEAMGRVLESEARLTAISSLVPAGLFTAKGPRLDYASQSLLNELGLPNSETLATDWPASIYVDDRARVAQAWQTALVEGSAFDCEYRMRRHDGVYRWYRGRSVPVRDSAGNIALWVGACWDIDDQKRIEEDLKRANQGLAASNRLLEQFAYVASHDLQEPLRTITTLTQLLDQRYADRLDAEARDHLHLIREASDRMGQLVRDLLAFSRATTTQTIATEAVPVDLIWQRVCHDLRAQIAASGAEITQSPLPVVEGGASQLAQVLQNLLSNALKYRRPGAHLQVRLEAAAIGPEWRFTLSDNGQGFASTYAEKIFIPFQRLHGREVPGTGVGLAIVKSIVERHGGRVEAQSDGPGCGARFLCTLPNNRHV